MTIANATNASGPFTVEAVLGGPKAANGTESAMQANLTLGTAPLPSGKCSSIAPGSYSTAAKSVQIARDESATYCVEVALTPNAPAALGGKTVNIVLPLSVSQLPAGTR